MLQLCKMSIFTRSCGLLRINPSPGYGSRLGHTTMTSCCLIHQNPKSNVLHLRTMIQRESGVYLLPVTANQLDSSTSLLNRRYCTPIPRHLNIPKHIQHQDPVKGKLIYYGMLSKMVKRVKIFSISTSVLGIALQPFIFMNSGGNVIVNTALATFLGFFIFVTPAVIHWVAKKYVTQLYYNSSDGTFTAHTTSFFLRPKQLQFKAEHVMVPSAAGLFTTISAHGQALFLDSESFIDKNAYVRLMGFDKPLDWEIPQPEMKK